MEIKNEALKSLYEDLVSGVWSFCPCTKDDIDSAFKKCDDELEKLQRNIETFQQSNGVLLEANLDLATKNKQLKDKCDYLDRLDLAWRMLCNGRADKIRNLEKEIEDLKAKMDDSLGICKIRQLEELEEEIGNLREKNKQLNNDNTALQHTVDDFVVKCKDLQQQLDTECKKRCDLQERLDDVGKRYYESSMRVGKLVREKEDLQNQLGSSNAALGRLRERYEEEVVSRRKWAKLAVSRDKRIEELQRQIDVLKQRDMVFVDLDSVKLKGMEELWAMIREVNSAPIEALYGSGAFNNKICVGTIVNMYPDVRDFVKEYKTWKNGKEDKDEEKNKQKCLDDMRDYLHKFCENRWCDVCPLSTDEFKCGRGYRFRKWCFPDNGAIPDEDLKRYYEKVRDWEKKEEQSSDQMRNWLESFCEKKETCIGCPFESDEFKCGYGFHDRSAISDEELKKYYEVARATEKEHKFEYGDAVRVPWRDYDYMYIGPEAKHIRLFNPKTHTVVYVSPNEHLEFRNSRIIVCEEEDLKKIRKG